MPKDPRIKKVLVIGSGPIIIGQAAEFDYSGTQACRALKAEGIETVLLNSNPATIMTDPDVADHVYIEPMTLEVVERILDIETLVVFCLDKCFRIVIVETEVCFQFFRTSTERERVSLVFSQYVDFEGQPSMDSKYNPNGSVHAIEGITSKNGQIIGKMGHSERFEDGLFQNIPGNKDQHLFASAVKYFTGK